MLSLHTSPAAQPGTGDAGGLNVYVLALAHALASQGTKVDIYTRHTPETALGAIPADATNGQPHHLAPNLRLFEVTTGPADATKQELGQYVPEFVRNVARVAGRHCDDRYTVIHAHYWLSGIAALSLRDLWNAPVIQTMHTLGRVKNAHLSPGDTPDPQTRIAGEQQLLDTCDHIIANTIAESADLAHHYSAAPSRVTVINPGVDTEIFKPVTWQKRQQLRDAKNLTPDDTHILFVGRLQPLKGPDVLLKAVAEILTQQTDLRNTLHVTLNGDSSGATGFTHEDLAQQAHLLNITDNITFQKPQPRRQLADTYRTADILTVPSYNETFGLVALEAAACGTPAVATNVGGLATTIKHNHTGVLIDGHNPHDWAYALRALINDPDRRLQFAHNATEHAQEFSWHNAARQTLDVYYQTIAAYVTDQSPTICQPAATCQSQGTT